MLCCIFSTSWQLLMPLYSGLHFCLKALEAPQLWRRVRTGSIGGPTLESFEAQLRMDPLNSRWRSSGFSARRMSCTFLFTTFHPTVFEPNVPKMHWDNDILKLHVDHWPMTSSLLYLTYSSSFWWYQHDGHIGQCDTMRVSQTFSRRRKVGRRNPALDSELGKSDKRFLPSSSRGGRDTYQPCAKALYPGDSNWDRTGQQGGFRVSVAEISRRCYSLVQNTPSILKDERFILISMNFRIRHSLRCCRI